MVTDGGVGEVTAGIIHTTLTITTHTTILTTPRTITRTLTPTTTRTRTVMVTGHTEATGIINNTS